MKKNWPIGFAIYWVLFLLSISSSSLAQNDQLLRREIEKIIEYDTKIGVDDRPDFIIGIVDHDSIYCLIFEDTIEGELSDSSIFELGGLTKVFIADLCHKLSAENKIDLQSKLNDYLPSSHQNELLAEISVKNLLTHTSGLISKPANLGAREVDEQDPYANYSKTDLLDYVMSINSKLDVGSYIYSHLNYGLLEIILEQATGQPLDTLLNQYILKENHMYSSYLNNSSRHPTAGYDRAGRPASPWHFPSFAASEGLKSTCTDLINYIKSQLLDEQKILQFRKLLIPYAKLKGSQKAFVTDGWHFFKNRRPGNLYLHSGKTSGHAASIHFIIETKTAVVLLTNSPVNMDGLATLVLRMINNNWRRKK